MEISEGKLLVRVRLSGKRLSVFEDALIDTGSTFTVVPPEIADRLQLETYQTPKIKLTTASGFIEVPVRLLDSIEIAHITLVNIPAVVHRIPDPSPVKVLIGMNLLAGAKLLVDGKHNRFDLEDP